MMILKRWFNRHTQVENPLIVPVFEVRLESYDKIEFTTPSTVSWKGEDYPVDTWILQILPDNTYVMTAKIKGWESMRKILAETEEHVAEWLEEGVVSEDYFEVL